MNEPLNDVVGQVGRNLHRLQKSRGLSTQDLAEATSIDRVRIEMLLRGEGELLADSLFLLAGALRVSPEELAVGIVWVPGEGGGEFRIRDPGTG